MLMSTVQISGGLDKSTFSFCSTSDAAAEICFDCTRFLMGESGFEALAGEDVAHARPRAVRLCADTSAARSLRGRARGVVHSSSATTRL